MPTVGENDGRQFIGAAIFRFGQQLAGLRGIIRQALQLIVITGHARWQRTVSGQGIVVCDDVDVFLAIEGQAESLPYFDQALAKNSEFQEAQVFKGMALYFLGRSDEAMEIGPFRTEFLARFKNEIARGADTNER